MQTLDAYSPRNPLLHNVVDKIVFWRRDEQEQAPLSYLPNNISGFGLTLSGSMYVKSGDNYERLPDLGTRNLLLRSGELITRGTFLNISVRCQIPAGLCLFTKIPMNRIYEDQATDLNYIFAPQEMSDITEQLSAAPDDRERLCILESFLVAKLTNRYPPVLAQIVQFIHASGGLFNISYIARHFYISERSLHRYFNTYIGIAPVVYINLIRFRSALHVINKKDKMILSDSLDFGYYDQAHFIRHFKKFSSVTPGQFLKARKEQKLSDFYNL